MNVDKEHIIGYFQNIIHICDRTTTGNLSHQMSNIRITYSYIADKIKEQYGEGKLEKVYTIRDSDTTYKWVYREKS